MTELMQLDVFEETVVSSQTLISGVRAFRYGPSPLIYLIAKPIKVPVIGISVPKVHVVQPVTDVIEPSR